MKCKLMYFTDCNFAVFQCIKLTLSSSHVNWSYFITSSEDTVFMCTYTYMQRLKFYLLFVTTYHFRCWYLQSSPIKSNILSQIYSSITIVQWKCSSSLLSFFIFTMKSMLSSKNSSSPEQVLFEICSGLMFKKYHCSIS